MAPARILIDGYSLLHAWPEIAQGHPRHSASARDALAQRLAQYQDAGGVPLTLIFDGTNAPASIPPPTGPSRLEILYSRAGQTADDLIERAVPKLLEYGEILVVTDDHAERETVLSLGAMALSCEVFISELEETMREFESQLKKRNRRELERFKAR